MRSPLSISIMALRRRSRWCRHDSRSKWRLATAAFLGVTLLASCSGPIPWPDATGFDGSPSWSPDGHAIAYFHRSGGHGGDHPDPSGIYLLDLTTGRHRLIYDTGYGYAAGIDWSPDGRALVLATGEGLVRLDVETGMPSLIHPGGSLYPSWSPASDSIAFENLNRVWLVGTSGGTPRMLRIAPDPLGFAVAPDWSTDGRSLLVVTWPVGSASSEVCRVDMATGSVRRLTDNAYSDYDPNWSPNGDRIAWIRHTVRSSGRIDPQLCVIDSSGAERKVLADCDAYEGVSWSPDGERLVFAGDTRLGSRLFVIDRDGHRLQQITH